MARVLIATQSWGVIQDRAGNAQPNKISHIANTDGTAATTWTTQTSGSSTTADQLSGIDGSIPRWLDEGEYDLTISGITKRVQAVSGASGAVIPLSLIDAKGDVIVGSADNAVMRKGIGADGQVLTADSTAGGGLKWATPAATGGGGGVQSVTYAATITPDAGAGDTVNVGALTGNITINAPTHGVAGQSLRFIFTQDSTGGRTITWNAAFAFNDWKPRVGPSQVSTVEFIYDGTNWRQLTQTALTLPWFFNPLDYGATGDGSTDDLAAINRTVTAADNAARGSVVWFDPTRQFVANGTITLDGMDSITLCSGTDARQNAARIVSSSTGSSPLISMVGSSACKLRGLRIENTSALYTGTLIELGSALTATSLFEISDCYIRAVAQASSSAVLLSIYNSYSGTIQRNRFYGGKYQIVGRTLTAHFSNAQTIRENLFEQADLWPIWNPGVVWNILCNTFEPLRSTAPGALSCDPAIVGAYSQGPDVVRVHGNWVGDAQIGGTWFQIAGDVWSFEGNLIDGGVSGTAVGIKLLGAVHGLGITGENRFHNLATAIDFNSQTFSAPNIAGNYYTSVTTRFANTSGISAADGGLFIDGDFSFLRATSALAVFNKSLRFSGTAAGDNVIYQDQLASGSSNYAHRVALSGDAFNRYNLRYSGWVYRGDGTVDPDVVDAEGNGSPEGVVTGAPGSTFKRRDGASGTCFYVKESGTGNTGWVGVGSTLAALTVSGTGKTAIQLPDTSTTTGLTFGADTTLYRRGSHQLATDDRLFFGAGLAAGSNALTCILTGDAQPYWNMTTAGTMNWGPGGSTSTDTKLYRNGAAELKTDGILRVGTALVVGTTQTISGTGKTALALSDTTTTTGITIGADANLYRNAADVLKTDDSLHVSLDFRHLGTNLGFYNHATATQQTVTGSRGANAALASLLTALAASGLIVDSSS